MAVRDFKIILVSVIAVLLIAVPSSADQAAQSDVVPGGAAEPAPLSANELQALVAPIALYPDQLVAEILAAATFPDQIAVANYWLQQNKALKGALLAEAVNRQSWNDSVKALTQFPAVLDNMAKNLNWVSTLGEAYHNQASEVMAAIQKLRTQAKANGTLKSGPEITVSQESPQVISIEPTDQNVVYVPEYDPSTVYGVPYVTPGYTASDIAAGSLLGFGAGVGLGALAGAGWGWDSWSPDWNAGTVTFNHNDFYGNPAWHGGYYNGAYHTGYGYQNAWTRAAANRGYANRLEPHEFAGEHLPASDSWARADNAFRRSNAFSGFGDRFGEDRFGEGHFGGFGGWQSRADSFRGWGSLRADGFRDGRFGGGRFGGGGFHGFRGGGFRRR
jgi:hypothetical protein